MKRNQHRYNVLRYLLDAISITLAFGIINVRHMSGMISDFSFFPSLTFLFISLTIWYFSSFYSKLYAERRSNKFSEEIIFVLYNTLIFCILNSSLLFFLQPSVRLPLREYTEFVLFVFLLTTIVKYLHRKYVHAILWQGNQYDKILLVGGNASAEYFYETVNKYYYYGYKCIGFLDDQINKLNGCQFFGRISDLHAVLGQQTVDEVVITLPDHEHEQIRSCVEVCGYHNVQVRLLPDAYKYATSAVEVDNIGIMPVLNISRLPLDRPENRLAKRLFDISFSLLFFCTFGIIVFPLIALLIWLTSKGPILFRQERWGLNNDRITCYKFRTMFRESSEVDEQGRYLITTKNDPRITRIGKFLRRTNLDELPQFWNVLIGNMSIVGPRPHPTPMNLESMHTVENYMLRHIVPPGITGWAQVNGLRGEVKNHKDMQRRVDFDLYYIHRWTFWLDCQIILQTIVNFVRGDQNAY